MALLSGCSFLDPKYPEVQSDLENKYYFSISTRQNIRASEKLDILVTISQSYKLGDESVRFNDLFLALGDSQIITDIRDIKHFVFNSFKKDNYIFDLKIGRMQF